MSDSYSLSVDKDSNVSESKIKTDIREQLNQKDFTDLPIL